MPHLRYFRTSRSTGTMFASTLRCVMTTPLGSAVAPDVKMISATSSRADRRPAGGVAVVRRPVELVQPPDRRAGRCRAIGGTSWPTSTSLRRHDPARRARESRATRGSRSGRRRRRRAGSPRTRRSTRAGSRRRRRPCRPCAGRRRAGAPRTRAPRGRPPGSVNARLRKPSSWTRNSPRARGEVVEEIDERVAAHG